MNDKRTVIQQGGISLWGVLMVVFIVLKLTGVGAVASWSWIRVFLTAFLIPIGVTLVALIAWLMLLFIMWLMFVLKK